MLAAIGDQESGFAVRDQLESRGGVLTTGQIGPATGFWQFERGGGVKGVMSHRATQNIALYYVDQAGLPFDTDEVWRSFTQPTGDRLAAVFARLLLLTDPKRIPPVGPENEDEAFELYLRCWRPGAWFNFPHGSQSRVNVRNKWTKSWANALASVYNVEWGTTTPPSTNVPDVRSDQLKLVAEIRERLQELEVLIREG